MSYVILQYLGTGIVIKVVEFLVLVFFKVERRLGLILNGFPMRIIKIVGNVGVKYEFVN